jgi:hypothetical protein
MGMSDQDDIDVCRVDTCRPHVGEQLARTWGQGTGAHIDQRAMRARIHVQVCVWRGDVLDRQVVLPQSLFDLLDRHVGKEILDRIVHAAVAERDAVKIAQAKSVISVVHRCPP